MSVPYPPPYEQPGQAPRRGKPWLLIISGVVSALALLLCAVGGFLTFGTIADLDGATTYTGSTTVTLSEGEKKSVFSQGESDICTVSGPGGMVDSGTATDVSVAWDQDEWHQVASFTAETDGAYTVTCGDQFVVIDAPSTAGSLIGIAGGVLCCLGGIGLVIGLILWLTRRKR